MYIVWRRIGLVSPPPGRDKLYVYVPDSLLLPKGTSKPKTLKKKTIFDAIRNRHQYHTPIHIFHSSSPPIFTSTIVPATYVVPIQQIHPICKSLRKSLYQRSTTSNFVIPNVAINHHFHLSVCPTGIIP